MNQILWTTMTRIEPTPNLNHKFAGPLAKAGAEDIHRHGQEENETFNEGHVARNLKEVRFVRTETDYFSHNACRKKREACFAYLDEAVSLKPRDYSEAEPEGEHIPERHQDHHDLLSDGSVAVNDVRHRSRSRCTEDEIGHSSGGNCGHGRKVLSQTASPEKKSDGTEDERGDQAP